MITVCSHLASDFWAYLAAAVLQPLAEIAGLTHNKTSLVGATDQRRRGCAANLVCMYLATKARPMRGKEAY